MSWDTKIINKFGASSLEKRALSRRAKCKLFWVGQEYKTVQKDLRLCRFCGFHVHKIHKIWTILYSLPFRKIGFFMICIKNTYLVKIPIPEDLVFGN